MQAGKENFLRGGAARNAASLFFLSERITFAGE